jgi:hypothetical protein
MKRLSANTVFNKGDKSFLKALLVDNKKIAYIKHDLCRARHMNNPNSAFLKYIHRAADAISGRSDAMLSARYTG